MHRNLEWHGVALLALSLAVLACDGGGGEVATRAFSVRDGAGVAIIESGVPDSAAGWGWRIDPSPLVEMRVGGDAPGEPLFEVAGALRLADGRLVVANGGAGALLFFAPDGALLGSAGGEGAGPGEFRSMDALWAYRGDSIAVFDAAAARVSVFDGHGRYGRTMRLDGGGALLDPIGVFDDGSVVFGVESVSAGTGVWRDSAIGLRVLADGSQVDTLGRWPTEEKYAATHNGRPVLGIRPFGRRTWAAAGPRTLHLATGDAFRIAGITPDGRLRRVVRAPIRGRRLTGADIDRYERERLDRIQGAPAFPVVRAVFESGQVPYPDRLPPHGRILVEASGGLWVERAPRPGERTVRWFVFAPDGRWSGEVMAPAGLELLQVAPDRVLGVHRDELGVETVRLHRLERGGVAVVAGRAMEGGPE